MSEGAILDLFRASLQTLLISAAPFVVTALVVGLVAAVIQAATQLQENALSFVPKILAMAVVLTVAGPWILSQLTGFARTSFSTVVGIGAEAGK